MPRMRHHCEDKRQANQSQEAKFTHHKCHRSEKWNDRSVRNQKGNNDGNEHGLNTKSHTRPEFLDEVIF